MCCLFVVWLSFVEQKDDEKKATTSSNAVGEGLVLKA
jgi:hypothetical protein